MLIKLGPCAECVTEGIIKNVPIVNVRHKLCLKHNRLRLNSQREKPKNYGNQRSSQTYQFCTDWGFTTELSMFAAITDDRGLISEFSGLPVPGSPINFLHILAKGLGKYPNFRFNPDNIWIGTEYEHFLIDHGNESLRAKYGLKYPIFLVNLKKYRQKESALKIEYAKRFGS